MIPIDILREHMEEANGDLTVWQEDWIVKAMKAYAEQQVKLCSMPDVGQSLVCNRVNRFDNNRCVNCGAKAGQPCELQT